MGTLAVGSDQVALARTAIYIRRRLSWAYLHDLLADRKFSGTFAHATKAALFLVPIASGVAFAQPAMSDVVSWHGGIPEVEADWSIGD